MAGWLGLVMHRAELVQQLGGDAEARGRREARTELLAALTPRQREVAALIAGGLTNRAIAERLTLTPGTVANHVDQILGRLGFRSRTEVAALVADLGAHRPSPKGKDPTP